MIIRFKKYKQVESIYFCCCVICICLHILVRQSNIVGSGNNPMSSAMYVGMLLRLESLSLLWSAFVLRLYMKENQNCKYQNLFRFLCWTVFFCVFVLCLVCPSLPMSGFLIAASVFSNVNYFRICKKKEKEKYEPHIFYNKRQH